MLETQRSRQIAEGVAAVPGVLAALYGAIAYDRGTDPDGLLVRMFAWYVDLQIRVFGGDTYSGKLALLMMAVPLILPPALALRFWLNRRPPASPSVSP